MHKAQVVPLEECAAGRDELDNSFGTRLWSWKREHPPYKSDEVSSGSGVRLDVINLSYSVEINKVVKQILHKVDLRLHPGEMCALMGPSGSGKR